MPTKPKTIDMTAPKGEYMIAFDTTNADKSGFLNAVKVTLEPAHLAMDEVANLSLCDHPLYPKLRQYVLSNLKNTRGR